MSAFILPGVVAEFAHRGRTVRFFVRNMADSIQGRHAQGEFYEAPELAIIERHLKPGGAYLDVGANVGNHAVFVALFGGQSEIIVVEPNPDAVALLRINLLLNRLKLDVRHLGVGLSDAEQAVEAAIPRNNLGGARMTPKAGGRLKLVPGDSLFAQRRIDFIKLDVEGQEMAALKGLEATIAASRPTMFVEVDDANRAEFESWVEGHAYTVVETYRRYPTNENLLVAPGA